VSPQSSVAFHPAVLIVVLRWYASNKLIFRRHASKNPGGLGAEPPRSMGSNSKTFRFSNRLACLSPRRSLLPQPKPWGRRGAKRLDVVLPQPKPWGRRGAKRLEVVLYSRILVCIRGWSSRYGDLLARQRRASSRKSSWASDEISFNSQP
jgi:hypothetical protein